MQDLGTYLGLDAPAGRRLAVLALVGGALVTGANALPLRVGVVSGVSMEPALHAGQPFLWKPNELVREPIRRGEVVLVKLAGQVCVKRVLAVGGDHFWCFANKGDPLNHSRLLAVGTPVLPWRKRYSEFAFRRVRVPAGHIFVVGDGMTSCDSRELGPVPADEILGRVVTSTNREDESTVGWSRIPSLPHPRLASRPSHG